MTTATTAIDRVLAFVRAQVGKPYSYGGTGPGSFDCSGLVQAAYASVGVTLPRTSESQSAIGHAVSLSALEPGDIVYWGSPGGASHDAIYMGNDTYIAAENPRLGVVLLPFSFAAPDGARRL